MAVRELAPRHRAPDRVDDFLSVLKAFALRDPKAPKGTTVSAQFGIDVPAARGRADSGDLEVDLTELFTDAASVAADLGVGIALFVDEMQDMPAEDVSALCAACHELSQVGGPLIVVGAGLPHLPSVLSASKSYSERLFRYARIDRLDREAADQALLAPAERRGRGQPDHLRGRQGGGAGGRGRARGRFLRLTVRAGDPGRARVHARDGRDRGRAGADLERRR